MAPKNKPEITAGELVLPDAEKSLWPMYAEMIAGRPAEEIIPHLSKIMTWYQDLNWPGIDIIHKLIMRLPKDVAAGAVCEAFKAARDINDEEWAYNLGLMFPETKK